MLDYCCIIIISLLLSLNILPLVAEQNSALLVVGGLSEISVDSQSRSPILRSVELVSCPGEGAASTSYHLPDYPREMFGGQAVWHGDEMMVCGGANWSTTYDQCYTWSIRDRSPRGWTEIGKLNYPRAFGYLAYLPEPLCQEKKLFILGGMNSVTLEPVLTTEVYHEETGTWLVHKQIPGTVDRNIFINRADSGCISSREGRVYSVGEEVIALDWTLLSLSVVTKLPHSAKAEGCTAISLDSDNFGFFFLSGDFYSITHSRWTQFKKPEPAFNIFSINNQPVILGFASIQSNCEESEGCLAVRRTLYGDKRVVQHNLETDTWQQIGYLEHSRLGYSIAVEVPADVCHGVQLRLGTESGQDDPYLREIDDDLGRIEKLKQLNILASDNKTRHSVKVQNNETSDSESSELIFNSNGSSTEFHTVLTFLVFFLIN